MSVKKLSVKKIKGVKGGACMVSYGGTTTLANKGKRCTD
jgi:hypothetical protein